MNEKVRVLIVDDEPDIREYMSALISAEYLCEIMQADSGSQAVQLLLQNHFDLVISDFNMPNGDGKLVFDMTQKVNPKAKFLLVSSDESDDHKEITSNSKSGYLQKPFEPEDLIKLIAEQLNIVSIDAYKDEFTTMSLSAIRINEVLPFDIYLNLGVKHYVKYFNAHKQLTQSEKDRLKKLKTNEVHIRTDEFKKFIGDRQRTVFDSIILPVMGLEHPFDISSINDELTHLGLNSILNDKEIMDLTQKNLKTVFALVYKVKAFDGLVDWVNSSELCPKKMHSILLTLFCNIILKNMKSAPFDFKIYLNLGYCALLHDLNLDDYMIKNESKILNGIKLNLPFNKSEQELLIEHVNKVVTLVSSWAHCPQIVIDVISQHHERPSGSGFPNKIDGSKISNLAGIFNVAHDMIDLVWARKTGADLHDSVAKLASEYKGYKHFEEPLEIIIREVLMK